MFDIGFSEFVLIGVIALLVFGPEDLPRVARTTGHLLGKLRRYVADVKSEISREMEEADLKRLQTQVQDSVQSIQATVNEQARLLEDEFRQTSSAFESVSASLHEESAKVESVFALGATSGSLVEAEGTPEAVVGEGAHENQLDLFGQPVGDALQGSERKEP